MQGVAKSTSVTWPQSLLSDLLSWRCLLALAIYLFLSSLCKMRPSSQGSGVCGEHSVPLWGSVNT